MNKENKKQERAGEVAQGVGPEFNPQYCKKTKTKKNGSATLPPDSLQT
jgi:hypothetical protein